MSYRVTVITYRDDICVFMSADSSHDLREEAEAVMGVVLAWSSVNYVDVNTQKTHFLPIRHDLSLESEIVQTVYESKWLGVLRNRRGGAPLLIRPSMRVSFLVNFCGACAVCP